MYGDGELRLAIMATLAQEESRKVSERVKAGQHIIPPTWVFMGELWRVSCGDYLRIKQLYDLNMESRAGTQRHKKLFPKVL